MVNQNENELSVTTEREAKKEFVARDQRQLQDSKALRQCSELF